MERRFTEGGSPPFRIASEKHEPTNFLSWLSIATQYESMHRNQPWSLESAWGRTPPGKISRARGGCLGTGGLRRTRQAAKSRGEPHRGYDPRVSERENPMQQALHRARAERIGSGGGTGGTETSKYPEEEKPNGMPGVAASETGRRPNRRAQRALGAPRRRGCGTRRRGAPSPPRE